MLIVFFFVWLLLVLCVFRIYILRPIYQHVKCTLCLYACNEQNKNELNEKRITARNYPKRNPELKCSVQWKPVERKIKCVCKLKVKIKSKYKGIQDEDDEETKRNQNLCTLYAIARLKVLCSVHGASSDKRIPQ